MSLRCPSNGEHVVETHGRVSDENRTDSTDEVIRCLNLLAFRCWCQQAHRDGQQDEATCELQVRDHEQLHRDKRQAQADKYRGHRNDDGVVTGQRQIEDDDRAQRHEELRRKCFHNAYLSLPPGRRYQKRLSHGICLQVSCESLTYCYATPMPAGKGSDC